MIPRDASGTLPDTIAIVDAIRSDAKVRIPRHENNHSELKKIIVPR
jgi:hypothetical protein